MSTDSIGPRCKYRNQASRFGRFGVPVSKEGIGASRYGEKFATHALVEELRERGTIRMLDPLKLARRGSGIPRDINLTLDGWAVRVGKARAIRWKLRISCHGVRRMIYDVFVQEALKCAAVKEGIGHELLDMRDVGIERRITRPAAQARSHKGCEDWRHRRSYARQQRIQLGRPATQEGLGKLVIYICARSRSTRKRRLSTRATTAPPFPGVGMTMRAFVGVCRIDRGRSLDEVS